MALRGTPARRSPHGALPGILRDLERRTRRPRRLRGPAGPAGESGPAGPAGLRGPAGDAGSGPSLFVEAVVVTTNKDGRAVHVFDAPLPEPPVVVATPVAPGVPVTAVLEVVTGGRVAVRVWAHQAVPLSDGPAMVPAGPGVAVHLAVLRP